jgi:hypothetical protein
MRPPGDRLDRDAYEGRRLELTELVRNHERGQQQQSREDSHHPRDDKAHLLPPIDRLVRFAG